MSDATDPDGNDDVAAKGKRICSDPPVDDLPLVPAIARTVSD
jgi:hypothetical protein